MILPSQIAKARSAPSANASGPMPPPSVTAAVREASARTGVNFAYLMTQAAVESGYDTQARARTSSATGLYQFIDSTWLDMVRRHGPAHGLGREAAALAEGGDRETREAVLALREDARLSAAMAAEFARENGARLKEVLGREPNATELYMAHFLGAGGASSFLTAMAAQPDRSAAEVLPAAAAANPGVFHAGGQTRSLDEVYQRFAARFSDDGDSPAIGPKRSLPPDGEPGMHRAPGAVMTADFARHVPAVSTWQAQLFASRLPLPGDSGSAAI